MKKPTWVIRGFLTFIACLAWLVTAMDYGDAVAVGTYSFRANQENSTLVLRPDHTFRQTLSRGTNEQHSEGTWRREGQGGISFSREFLVVKGAEPEPDGTTFADMQKAFGVFTSLHLRQYHVLWYGKGSSDKSPLGTYKGDKPGVDSTLTLNANHIFRQNIAHGETTNDATGTWSQDDDGNIRFSSDFLKTTGEPLTSDETASSTPGENLQIVISMSGQAAEPVFYKK